MLTKEKPYEFPSPGETPLLHSPVIVGSGPAGLFCGWYLAKAGYCPIILERGEEAEKRQKTVENFWKMVFLTLSPMYSSERAAPAPFPTES